MSYRGSDHDLMVSSGLYSRTYYTILQLMSLEVNSISILMQNYKMTPRLYTHLTESWKVTEENTQDNKKRLQKESFKVTVHTLKCARQHFYNVRQEKTWSVYRAAELFRVNYASVQKASEQESPESEQQTDGQTRYGAQRHNVVA